MVGEEVADVITKVFLDDRGNFDGQDDLESRGADIPAQYVLGVRVGTAAGRDQFRSDCRPIGSSRDNRGGAVTEQAGRDQVCDRMVLALNGQRTQLDSE